MKLANPAPLGLTGFALTTWMLSLVNAGFFTAASVPMVLSLAFAFGGTAQFFAGLMEIPRGNTFDSRRSAVTARSGGRSPCS